VIDPETGMDMEVTNFIFAKKLNELLKEYGKEDRDKGITYNNIPSSFPEGIIVLTGYAYPGIISIVKRTEEIIEGRRRIVTK